MKPLVRACRAKCFPRLGLLSIGGPLIDDGHDVTLLDADVDNLPLEQIVERAAAHAPEILLIGHNGSTSAHPTVATLLRRLRPRLPETWFVYGGVFPTYHWRDVLEECPEADVIVRGEGEETVRRLVGALSLLPLWGRPGPASPSPLVAGVIRGGRKCRDEGVAFSPTAHPGIPPHP